MTVDLDLIEQQAAAMRKQLGVDFDIQLLDYERLMAQGVVGAVTCGRWRATMPLLDADLGIKVSPEAKKTLLSMGKKLLMPKEMVSTADAIESKARRLLDPKYNRAVYPTPMGTFIPVTAWADVKQRFDDCVADYMNIRDQWCDNIDDVRLTMIAAYQAAAREAWQRRQRENPDFIETEDEYVEKFTERVMAHLPSSERIRESFYLELKVQWIPLPSLMAAEMARKEAIELQVDFAKEKAGAARDIERRQEELARLEIERQRVETTDAIAARNRQLAELNAYVVKETKRELINMATEFEKTVAAQMNALIAEVMTDLLEALKTRKKLNSSSTVQLRNLVKTLGQANFTDDPDVNAVIGRVNQVLKVKLNATDRIALSQTLQDIRVVATDNLLRIGAPAVQSRVLEPVEMSRANVATSRQRLALAPPVIDLQPGLALKGDKA